MTRTEKREFVDTLKHNLQTANLVVVTRQTGLTVSESSELRTKMREAGASFKVIKNSLGRLVVRDTKLASIEPHLTGPAALAYSVDSVAAARVAVKFMEENPKLSVVAGVLGDKLLDIHALKSLASLPSLDVMRAKILGTIAAPLTQLAIVVREPGASLARVISSYSNR